MCRWKKGHSTASPSRTSAKGFGNRAATIDDSAPELREAIQEIFLPPTSSTTGKAGPSIDYKAAERTVKSREITEEAVKEFARQNKVGEVIVSIAQLSNLSVDEIERLLMNTWTSPVAVIFKAIGFHLPTLEIIYRSRLSDREPVRNDLIQTKAEFIAIRRPTQSASCATSMLKEQSKFPISRCPLQLTFRLTTDVCWWLSVRKCSAALRRELGAERR